MRALAAAIAVLLVAAPWAPKAEAPQSSSQAGSPTVRIGILKNGAYEVTTLPLEDYVARVLAGEALPGSPPAAMDALAVAIRTYTQTNLGRHKAEGFDLCDQTHCQVMRTSTPVSERAARATAGQILTFKGTPATIYYSASCGGHTEVPSAVWPGADDPPYLPSQPDDGCGGGPLWTAELALSDLRRSFAAAGYTGSLKDVRVGSRDSSGRVATLRLDGLTPQEVSGQDLRAIVGRTLGWQYVRSAAFEMKRSGDIFRLDGRGSGHGVGMCVIGSARLAEAGRSAQAILTHYYPGVQIGAFNPQLTGLTPAAPAPTVLPPTSSGVRAPASPSAGSSAAATAPMPAAPMAPAPTAAASIPTGRTTGPAINGVAVSLPAGADTADRTAISAAVARERDALARVLGVAAPQTILVSVWATNDEYQRATGRPWFTAASLVKGSIHLAPLAPLRDRGVLDRSIREQIVHLLVDDYLRQRPAWVREGAAQFYSQSATAGTAALSRVECPADVDLERPISPGALSTANTQARACFERQVTSGRSWRDVR